MKNYTFYNEVLPTPLGEIQILKEYEKRFLKATPKLLLGCCYYSSALS